MVKKIIYTAYDASTNIGIWVTDGTSSGTSELLAGTQPNNHNLNPYDLTLVGNKILFVGTDSSGNQGLWVTDGTAGGTSEILPGAQGPYNLSPGPSINSPGPLALF